MKRFSTLTLLVVAIAASSSGAPGSVLINVDFGHRGLYNGATEALPLLTGTWNGVATTTGATSGSNISLVDSQGNSTGVTLAYTAQQVIQVTSQTWNMLMNDQLALNSGLGNTNLQVTLSGLAEGLYNLYVYGGSTSNFEKTIKLSVGSESLVLDSSGTNFQYMEGKNWGVFRDVAVDNTGTLVINGENMRSDVTAAFNGFQLLQGPEPTILEFIEYREGFGVAAGAPSDQPLGTVDWYGHYGSNATNDSASAGVLKISRFDGKPTGLDNINAGVADHTSRGYAYKLGSETPGIAWTDEHSIRVGEISSFKFHSRNSNGENEYRVAIRIGEEDWFASATTFHSGGGTGTSSDFTDNAIQHILLFSTDADAWHDLAFIPDVSLELGDVLTDPLPAGNVTAFGLYMDGPSASTMRFDTFEVWVVPEPTSWFLMLCALACGLLVRRRRGKN
ncbi:MAG: PEP-CTERM sorting domain-containing protein [Thermoguttaceae bacterium]|jgi:hypothetical protein|nr:PEP-CTERM sorting domain-containing protein [Thermoguttaceae bacterium]